MPVDVTTIFASGGLAYFDTPFDHSELSIVEQSVQLDLFFGVGYSTAAGDWSHLEEIGTLPADTYTLTVRAFEPLFGLNDTYTTSFTVVPEPTTRSVPGDYPSIQAAINAARSGDMVIVADGFYTGPGNRDIDFRGKAITVRSANGPEFTTIDCNGTNTEPHRGFYFHRGEGASSVLDGLTITNGYAPLMQYQAGSHTYNYWAGGAIFCYQSSPTISNCRLINNYADWFGGAISGWNSDAIITGCTIMNNVSHSGGGIYCRGGTPVISNCVIADNKAEVGVIGLGTDAGGGIYCHYTNGATITNCVITENVATVGGGIYCHVGMSGIGFNDVVITNCTFSANTAQSGGAVRIGEGSNTSMVNCILWGDSAPYGPEIAMSAFDWGSALSISYSDVHGGQAAIYDIDDLDWGPSNINMDPLFADAVNGDYHLLEYSPCIDNGDPNHISEPNETDLDGNPRIVNDQIDMGVYEYSPPIDVMVKFTPQTLNCNSKGKWLTCYIWLPEDCNVADIEPNTIRLLAEPNDIYPEWIWFDQDQQVVMAKFSRPQLQQILLDLETPTYVELLVSGQLNDGNFFEGTDTIRLIEKTPRLKQLRSGKLTPLRKF